MALSKLIVNWFLELFGGSLNVNNWLETTRFAITGKLTGLVVPYVPKIGFVLTTIGLKEKADNNLLRIIPSSPT